MQWERKNTATQTEIVNLFEDLSDEEQLVLNCLHSNEDGVHVNFLVMETGISYPQMIALLMEMEMKDIVHGLPGGVYRALK
jgi:predicted Rossmann fold nucleotide-binding protein DprA/Smf involved in DNA uptake